MELANNLLYDGTVDEVMSNEVMSSYIEVHNVTKT